MIYSLTALLLFLISLNLWNSGDSRKTKILFKYAIIWLILIDGLRWEIGTDWDNYYTFFYDQSVSGSHMGVGYTFFTDIVRYFSDSYNVFLILFAIFNYVVYYKTFVKYSPNPVMSLCICYCLMMGSMGSNRQILAMLICLLSIKYVIDKNIKLFLIVWAIAVLFHYSALVFIISYFLYKLDISNGKCALVVLGCFVLGGVHAVNYIPFVDYLAMFDSYTSNTDFSSYLDVFDGEISIFGSLKRLILLFIVVRTRKYVNNSIYDFFLYLYIVGCCIYFLFNGSVLQIVAGKLSTYFNIFECILMPFAIYYFPIKMKKKQRVFLWLLYFVVCFALMWKDINTYVRTVGFDIYNPYKTVLFL